MKTVPLRPGDTLYALAGRHGTTIETLQRLNRLGASTLIYAGDTLRVPSAPSTARDARAAALDRPAPKKPGTSGTKRPAKGGAAAVAFARAQLGKPYVRGGTGRAGSTARAW
ncbi:LysM peptidoglycan-binding domain-containing protein [Streptomyces sp. NPDC048604]|uniref:LysM peptidoglycan-binding domain-containing protein n=1 Tax=Streptomyces sp. NPDC048604 TaxID=3365578 RepID=UPI00371DAF7E